MNVPAARPLSRTQTAVVHGRGILGVLGMLGLLAAFAAPQSWADPGTGPGRSGSTWKRLDSRAPGCDGPGSWIDRHGERLGLEAATSAEITKISQASKQEQERLQVKLDEAQAGLRKLLGRGTPDEAAVMKQADEIGSIELAMRKNRLAAMLAIRSLLTEEQRETLLELKDEFRRP